MADSWEESEDIVLAPVAKPVLRANAPSFSFNPGASQFSPVAFAPPPPRTAAAPPGFASAAGGPDAQRQVPPPPPPAVRALADDVMEEAQPAHADTPMETETEPAAVDAATAQLDRMAVDEPADSASDSATGASPDPSQPTSQPASAAVPSSSPESPAEVRPSEPDHAQESNSEAKAKRVQAALEEMDQRDHMNVVFIGHVDAGKSTIGGQILYLTGGVDDRTIQKYEREAKEKNRESWYMAYIMDTNDEERAKGKTVEVGRAHFETAAKRYTILDAPGHKNYVPNMIGGAAQADVGVLVIAARKGEFETGFDRGGQTREHAQLAKTLGVTKLIVAVNKMDDPSTVTAEGIWSQERYNEITGKLTPFLRSCGYNPKKDVIFVPISGLFGSNIKEPVSKDLCPWYTGGTLFEILDATEPFERDAMAPFRMPIIDKYKEMGTIVMGKSESGLVTVGDKLLVMPNKVPVTVSTVYRDDVEVPAAKGGENLKLRLTGIDEDDLAAGFVLCSRNAVVPAVTYFNAQLQILELLEHKAIFTAGYKCILHVHSVVEECECVKLIALMDPKTREKKKTKFVKSNSVAIVQLAVEKPICVELFSDVPQLGRFTLRDEGRTIAIGKIIKLPKPGSTKGAAMDAI